MGAPRRNADGLSQCDDSVLLAPGKLQAGDDILGRWTILWLILGLNVRLVEPGQF
jgi:hypothetical protein